MTETTITVNRTYKARIFEMVFSSKKELLALYNAVNVSEMEFFQNSLRLIKRRQRK